MCEFHLVRYYTITLLEVKTEWQIIENDESCWVVFKSLLKMRNDEINKSDLVTYVIFV